MYIVHETSEFTDDITSRKKTTSLAGKQTKTQSGRYDITNGLTDGVTNR